MAYTDKTNFFILDRLIDYVSMQKLAVNDNWIKRHFEVEHNFNDSTVDGTHKVGFAINSYLDNDVVTTAKIEDRAVTGAKISTNTINQGDIATDAIHQGELETAVDETSTTSSSLIYKALAGGSYCFYPQIKMSSTGSYQWHAMLSQTSSYSGWTTYTTTIALSAGASGGTIYAQVRYIQSSPPYKMGDTLWGHFLFLLRNPVTKEVITASFAEDPPWAYNGVGEKDSIERIQSVPHPFIEYWQKDPIVDGLEICLVDLRDLDVENWKKDCEKNRTSILADLKVLDIGNSIVPTDLGISEISGFTNKVIIRGLL
jgi:hypothetical protein